MVRIPCNGASILGQIAPDRNSRSRGLVAVGTTLAGGPREPRARWPSAVNQQSIRTHASSPFRGYRRRVILATSRQAVASSSVISPLSAITRKLTQLDGIHKPPHPGHQREPARGVIGIANPAPSMGSNPYGLKLSTAAGLT